MDTRLKLDRVSQGELLKLHQKEADLLAQKKHILNGVVKEDITLRAYL